jgi:hypothetical protein
MNLALVLAVGAMVGGLTGASIFAFAPEEPYKVETALATILRNILTSLLTAYSLGGGRLWLLGVGFGSMYGLATSLVVVLAQGGFTKGRDTPYVLIGGVITGAIVGLFDALLAFAR